VKVTIEYDPTNKAEVAEVKALLGQSNQSDVVLKSDAQAVKAEKPAAPKAKAAPKKAAPVEEADDDSNDEESTAVTLDDVRTRAKQLIGSGNREAVKEILDDLGAASVTKLTEDQYAQFIEAADAL